MTLRERMLKALRHEITDMVPCCPDISIMVPLRMKGGPFWQFYLDEDEGIFEAYTSVKLLGAYADACRHFGIPAWAWYVPPRSKPHDVEYRHEILEKRDDRIVTRTTMSTPEGSLWTETVYPVDNPPVPVRKYIKDFEKEFKFLKYLYPKLEDMDFGPVSHEREMLGDDGVNLVAVVPPSLAHLDGFVDGGLGRIGLLYYDHPELIARYKEMHENWSMEFLGKVIEAQCCDEILTGTSGLMTWQSPTIARELSLDGLKQITRACKKGGIISHLHCCGFENELVKMSALETDLDVIEPLEPPPQGDCDLKELKQRYGSRLTLKGNLHTSSVMLSDVETVEKAAIKCIEDAAGGGGFILSTGDQCGRDTPHENIFKLVEVCEKYGKY